MPILHEWDANEPLRTVLIGRVTYEDMIVHIDAVARAGAFARPEIIDARRVEGPPPSLSELRRLAAHARDVMGEAPAPRAIVINGSAVNALVAELFSVFMAGPMEMHVSRSEVEALRWLRERSAASAEPVGNGALA